LLATWGWDRGAEGFGGCACVCVCVCAGDDDTSVGSNLGANKNYTLPYKQAKEVKMREEL